MTLRLPEACREIPTQSLDPADHANLGIFPPIPTFPRNCFVSHLGKDEHLKIVYLQLIRVQQSEGVLTELLGIENKGNILYTSKMTSISKSEDREFFPSTPYRPPNTELSPDYSPRKSTGLMAGIETAVD